MTRQRTVFGILVLALGVSLISSPAEAGRAKDWRDIDIPPLTFERPEPDKRVLPNGMVVYLLENHRLPLVNLQAMVKTGSIYEPDDEAGVAQLTGMMMRMGGTANMSSEEVDEELDYLAAQVNTSIDQEAGFTSLNVPSRSLDEALAVWADVLIRPAFDEEQIEVAKNRIKEGIRRQNDNPIQVAIREFIKLLLGPDHPRARTPTFSSVDNLTRDHLVAFHRKYYRPNNMILGVAGDFDPDRIEGQLMQVFAGWEEQEVSFPPVPKLPYPTKPSVNFAQKDVPQTTILVGHLGINQYDPDHFAVRVMNDILGGAGFSSRIVETIRNDRGLAYFAGSFYQVETLDRGAFIGISMTKAESTMVALDLLIGEINRIRNEEVTEEELETAKNMRLNTEVFRYDSSAEIVNRLVYLDFYDLPDDYLQKQLSVVEGLEPADIRRVAEEYLQPDNLIIMAVGDAEKFDRPLSDYGKVNEIELSDPTQE